MNFRVLSVPHSGTRFVFDFLKKAGFEQSLYTHLEDGNYMFTHFRKRPHRHRVVYGYTGMITIVPIRQYKEVSKSWKRRNKNPKDLKDCWRKMKEFLNNPDEPNTLILRIDDPENRQNDLQKIEEVLKVDLSFVNFDLKVGEGR